jgi:pyruvate,water dikinase
MKKHGLIQGQNKLEVYVMAEIPSNIILAKEFAELFDGFSIGSNDLTQLTLGLDRDSAIISDLFDENNEAIKTQIKHLIETAKNAGVKVGLCGQAPSDYPEYTKFLVECGIDSISFNPDAMIRGIENIMVAEHL